MITVEWMSVLMECSRLLWERGQESGLSEGGNYGAGAVRLKSRRGGTGRGRGPPIGDEAQPDHKGHPLLGEEVEILSRKLWGSHWRALT